MTASECHHATVIPQTSNYFDHSKQPSHHILDLLDIEQTLKAASQCLHNAAIQMKPVASDIFVCMLSDLDRMKTVENQVLAKLFKNMVTYSMKVTDIYGGDATKRQVAEALKIKRTPAPVSRREEFTRCHLPRAVITDTDRQLAPTQ